MKKIKLGEVVERSSEDGILIYKYKKMRSLQRALNLLLGEGPTAEKVIPSIFQMDKDKVYYIQDYQNNEFYYQMSDELYNELKLNIDDYLDSLISSVVGMVDVNYGNVSEMKSSEDLIKKFKEKINSKEVKITEV